MLCEVSSDMNILNYVGNFKFNLSYCFCVFFNLKSAIDSTLTIYKCIRWKIWEKSRDTFTCNLRFNLTKIDHFNI